MYRETRKFYHPTAFPAQLQVRSSRHQPARGLRFRESHQSAIVQERIRAEYVATALRFPLFVHIIHNDIRGKEYRHSREMAKDNIAVRFGRRLRQLRKERKMNQVDLEALSGLGQSFISMIENGEEAPSLETLEVLALAFDVSLSELFKGV